jgi:DNA polymerase-3 subunit alpha
VNKKVIESLIKAGAFDSFGYKRSQLMAVLDRALELAQGFQKDRMRGQLSLFDTHGSAFTMEDEKLMPQINEWPKEQILNFEREYLGFYVSGHPLEGYEEIIKRYSNVDTKVILQLREGEEVKIGGFIAGVKKKTTRGDNQRMAIIELEDFEGSITCVLFPEVFERNYHLIAEGNVIFVKGKYSIRGDQPQIVVSEVCSLEEAPYKLASMALIELDEDLITDELLRNLIKVIEKYKGNIPFRIVYKEPRGKVILETEYRVEPKKELLEEIKQNFNKELILQ